MVMRVGGIYSGMDIEAMVNKLMEAERAPLERLKQQQTLLTWKRDAFREINSKLLEVNNSLLDMKLTRTYQPKTASSSQASAVTATAASSAANGTYEIQVTQLATSAMRIGQSLGGDQLETEIASNYANREYSFKVYGKDGEQTVTFNIEENDTLGDVLKKIEQASDGNVRAFFDKSANRVIIEATFTGNYNPNNSESNPADVIDISGNDFFNDYLKLGAEQGGTNAVFKYNNHLEITTQENSYTLNGITYHFHNETDGNARISVNTDVDQSFNKIMDFVNKYNELIDMMNKSQTEERYRDYKPLSEEQKKEMSDDQIKLWEERAKSGILKGESAIRDGMYELRRSLQGSVSNDSDYKLLSQIGIKTTMSYLDGGKLEVDEEKLKAALRDNPEDVYKLFANNAEGEARGLIYRFDDALQNVRGKIESQAGKSTQTLDNYALGKRMKEINERIANYEKRMIRIEQRYWTQFTQMEKAIASLSEQSSYLFSQFGA